VSTLHHLVESQARRTPEAQAVVTASGRLTYRELAAAVDRLAGSLAGLALAPRSVVGVCLDRDCRLVVAVLAVLKAGHAYLPLDPDYPRDRNRYMLSDSGATAVLTLRRHLDLVAGSPVPVIAIDDPLPSAVAPAPPAAADPEDLAYVLYTSGSTGLPKGVGITHRSAVALIRWAVTHFDAGELAGVLAATSLCFDLSAFELFAPLCTGGTVLLADTLFHLDTLPARPVVTLVNTVPSLLTQFLRDDALPATVRTVNLAGEALSAELVDAVFAAGTVSRVNNLYGPCEDTTYSTCAAVYPGDRPTIGSPIAGTTAYLLDGSGRPVERGEAGELHLGGSGLSRGYLHRPALTAERFVPDPYSPTPGARMYRTGDLARMGPAGQLEFIGRIDRQVKVNGIRIEPGEIEHRLRAEPGVLQAAVVVEATGRPDPLIVAYLVTRGRVDLDGLTRRLAATLPRHLVPRRLRVVDALPSTPSGKVDTAALERPAPPVHAWLAE
jgi:amino acid adenylation domain-containing protein